MTVNVFPFGGGGSTNFDEVPDGTEASPGLAFADDQDVGLFRPGVDQLGLVAAGTEQARVVSGQVQVVAGTQAAPSISFLIDPDTGILRGLSPDTLTFVGGGNVLAIANSETFRVGPNGSLATPAFGFTDDPNNGMYLPTTDQLGLVTGGTEALRLDSSQNVNAPNGDIQQGGTSLFNGLGQVEIPPAKASDQTVNNSTTLVDDNDLTVSIAANETVVIVGHIIFESNSTADFKHQFTGPSGSDGSFGIGGPRELTGGGLGGTGFYALNASIPTSGHGGPASQSVFGVVRNGGTSGNITLQWAQNTADASDTKVLADSFLIVWRV